MNKIIYLFLVVLLTACATPSFLPTGDYIRANYYIEIDGQVDFTSTDIKVERMPMYPKGIEGINNLISQNVKYPLMAVKAEIQGTVYVQYVVEKDGYIGRINVVRGLHPAIDREAIRVIKLMERWVPAIKDGKTVPVQFTQPIKFSFAD
jgi:periplasmic protein TonB